MSEPSLPGQSDFIREMQRLHGDQLRAVTPEEKDAATHEMAHFLRMAQAGRLQEWFASRKESA